MADHLEERYEIIKLLGKDAAGGVYLAMDSMLKRKVVFRHIDPDPDVEKSKQWAKEMAAYAGKLCAFQHPNILTVYDAPVDEDGISIVAQYVEGDTLASCLKDGPLSQIGTYRMAVDVIDALHAAHDSGVYHGALHTGSIKRLPRASGNFRYLILDLGLNNLATMIKGQDIHIADHVLLPPELHEEDREPDESADLFLLGQLCYVALAGGHPFAERSPEECRAAYLDGEFPSLTDYVPDMNPDFADWIMKMCSAKRSGRPESINDATDALQKIEISEESEPVPVAKVLGAGSTQAVPVAKPLTVATAPQTLKAAAVPTATLTAAVPTATLTAAVPTATLTASMHTTKVGAAAGATGEIQGSGDFLASSDDSNKKMIIILSSLAGVVVLGVVLSILFSGGGDEEGKQQDLSKVELPEGTKAHLHDPMLTGSKENEGKVTLGGEKTLDWVVLTGASAAGDREQNSGRDYRMNLSPAGRFTEAARDGIPAVFEVEGKELRPRLATDKAKGAKGGNGWDVQFRVPKKHRGSLIISLYVFQEWCALDIEVTLHNGEKINFQIPKQEPGVLAIPIEIPKPRSAAFYNVRVTAAEDTSGDFAIGLSGVHIEKR